MNYRKQPIAYSNSSPPMSPISRMRKALHQASSESIEDLPTIDPFDIESNKINKQLTSHEKYQYYIENGIPESEIDVSTEDVLSNAYKLVPEALLNNRFLLKYKNAIAIEIKEHHLYSVRKAILNYILLDVDEQKRLGIKIDQEQSAYYGRGPVPWHSECEEAKVMLKRNLWHLNPMMTKIKTIFEDYKASATFDFSFIENGSNIGLEEFVVTIKGQTLKIKDSLNSVYFILYTLFDYTVGLRILLKYSYSINHCGIRRKLETRILIQQDSIHFSTQLRPSCQINYGKSQKN